MKRTVSWLLTFALLLGVVPVLGVSAADTKIANPDIVTFEEFPVGTDLSGVFASGTAMATVSDAWAKGGEKSAELFDHSNTASAVLRYEGEASSFIDLKFDMLCMFGGFQFRISNGKRDADNTAFWIGFANKQVGEQYYTFLQYFDGVNWIDVYQFDLTFAGRWRAIQVQAAVDSKAAVFVDGQYIAEVPRCGTGFGTNVDSSVDSVIFECGSASGTGGQAFLDNLKMVPVYEAMVETFEDYAMGDIPHFPFTDANLATIGYMKSKEGTKAVCLADTVANQVAMLRGMTKKSAALALEFDMMPVTGQVQFRISNGSRNTANTAFWLKFANIQDTSTGKFNTHLQYYDGIAWVSIHTFNGALANNWNTVRVEASAIGSARVFVNGLSVGEALHCGGSYGTNAMFELDSVIFECGDTKNATWKYYLNNVMLEPLGPVAEDFEDVELTGSASTLPGYLGDVSAVVKADPVNAEGNALYLNGTGASQAPFLEYACGAFEKSTIEFNAFIEDYNNSVTVRVNDGREEHAAYVMQFNYASGLQVLSGSWDNGQSQVWTVLNEEVKLLTGVWNKIRIEINTMFDGEAIIYLNDDLVGNTDEVFYNDTPVCGVRIGTGEVGQSCYIDNLTVPAVPYAQLVTPEAVLEDFERLSVGTDLAEHFAAGTTMATVSKAKAKSGVNSVELCDTSATSAAFLRVESTATTGLTLDFDYNPAVGGITFRLSNGGRSNANTAFYLGFANKKGTDGAFHTYLQYYSGSAWIDVYEFAGTLANKWSAIHVEANVTDKAVVSVDGVKIGEAPHCSDTYGTNATTQIDSVIFECGSVAATGGKLYLDNIQTKAAPYTVMVTPKPVMENFGSVILSALVEKKEHLGAEVREDPVNAGGQSLLLHNSGQNKVPYIDYTFASYNGVILEFDVYLPTAANDVTFQLYNGNRSYTNTAFYLQFHHDEGLRSYDGAYNMLNPNVVLQERQWHKIRVEFVNGENSEATIYLNGVYVATAAPYNAKDSVNGVHFFTGSKTQSFYMDNISVDTSLQVTESGLCLLNDLEVDELTVEAGKILDLRGCTLTVENLACFGSIIDSSRDNTGLLVTDALILGEMIYLPIAVEGGYKFYDFELKSLGVRTYAAGSATYGFAMDFANPAAYELLAAGDCGVQINMNLKWDDNAQPFTFNSALLQQYAKLQQSHSNLQAAMMLTVTGLDELEAGNTLTVTPSVAAAGAEIVSQDVVYTVS